MHVGGVPGVDGVFGERPARFALDKPIARCATSHRFGSKSIDPCDGGRRLEAVHQQEVVRGMVGWPGTSGAVGPLRLSHPLDAFNMVANAAHWSSAEHK